MAYISIHPIKATLGAAIDYVCNPKKTDNHKNILSELCHFQTAQKMFQNTRENHRSSSKTLAFHIIQSFKEGEVTIEEAQEIGMETMKRFLNGEYEFVMATHNDTQHIHNHIIVNSVNMMNGKSFSREHDQYRCPAWKKLREISNEITFEKGLSVIRNPEKISKSYYEWSMEKQGTSWKAQIKNAIDKTVRTADDFNDFLAKLRSQNITVRYEPYKTKEGMILAFKMEGQKNYVYSQKLGRFYSEDLIRNRIERAVKRREMTPTERRQERILHDDGRLKKLHNISEFSEVGLREWAKKENRKIQMQTLNELHGKGFYSAKEFYKYHSDLQSTINRYSNMYSEMKQFRKELTVQTKYLKIYREYKEIHDYYKNKTLFPERYFRMHEQEILLFEEAESELKKIGNEIPNEAQLEYKMTEHNSNMTAVREKLIELREELRSYTTLKHNLDIIYEKGIESEAEKEGKEKSSSVQKQERKNTDNVEL